MKIKLIIIGIIIVCIMPSCYDDNRDNFEIASVPDFPVNFELVNSEYDDYNSTFLYNWVSKSFLLVFSTNRFSKGKDFDFTYYSCSANFNRQYGEFNITSINYPYERIVEILDSVNSSNNELGPFFAYDFHDAQTENNSNLKGDTLRLFYASDKKGNLDIYYCNVPFDENSGTEKKISNLNSEFDDAYPTIHYQFIPSIYFTSNRTGDFNIYRASSFKNKLITQTDSVVVKEVDELCSAEDDKCPFITGNFMVFASNRSGGYGGFDLWYSFFNGLEWSKPENFGKEINSEFDEYRPIIINTSEFREYRNDLMIFSSNRPGGKGGFDLYYVGTSALINNILNY